MGECGDDDLYHDELDSNVEDKSWTWTEPSDCSGDASFTSSWKVAFSTSGAEGLYGADTIEDYKYCYLKSFFEEVGTSPVYECYRDLGVCAGAAHSCQETIPSTVEYYIRHPSHESKYVYDFSNVSPTESEDDDASILGKILDVGTAVGGLYSPWASVGGAFIKAFIRSSSDAVTVDSGTMPDDNTRQYLWWTIEMAGDNSDDFPQAACDSAAAEFKISNNLSDDDSKDSFDLDSWVRHTYLYNGYDYCAPSSCDYDASGISVYEKTTDWTMNTSTFYNNE